MRPASGFGAPGGAVNPLATKRTAFPVGAGEVAREAGFRVAAGGPAVVATATDGTLPGEWTAKLHVALSGAKVKSSLSFWPVILLPSTLVSAEHIELVSKYVDHSCAGSWKVAVTRSPSEPSSSQC